MSPTKRHEELEAFLDRLRASALLERIYDRCGADRDLAGRQITTYLNEVEIGLDLIAPYLRKDLRILEVGSGLCALSLFLRSQGFNVTGLEPVGVGFGFFEVALPEVLASVPEVDLPLLRIEVETLDPAKHGYFDLIFSVNTLEHIADLDGAFRSMTAVLSPGGKMLHQCPNYHIPYEPHFARPLIPFAPGLSKGLMGDTGRLPGAWESLNFITYRRVCGLAKANRLAPRFEKGLLAEAVARLTRDPHYALRHNSTPVRMLLSLSRIPGLMALLKSLPPSCSTPMRFHLTHLRPEATT